LNVSGKVAEGGFSAADRLELDVPLGFWVEGAVLIRCQFGEDFGVLCFEDTLDEAPKAGSEGAVVNEELAGVFWAMEGFVFGVEGDGGNDDVDVGMVLDLSAPGVEDGGEVEGEVWVFELGAGDVVEGLGTGF
jgi:hypothetical protein